MPWISYARHYVATGKDLFSDEGIKVEEFFLQTISELTTASLAGNIDIAWVTTGDAVQAISRDPNVGVIYVVDYSNAAEGVLGRNIRIEKFWSFVFVNILPLVEQSNQAKISSLLKNLTALTYV